MFKTVLVIYYLTGHFSIGRSEVWLQNEQRSNASVTASENQSREPSVNITDTVTAVLINVNTQGAPRSLNVTDSSALSVKRQPEPRKVHKRSEENLRLVYQSTSSNPKNDVEVFRPLEGSPPGYGPQAPQPPSFPPSLPDYPSGIYPYEPPYYYPLYPNDYPPYQPHYPPPHSYPPAYPAYPTSPSQLPKRTRSHPKPTFTTVMRTHETEPTTPSTSELEPPGPAKEPEPEPEVIVPIPKKPKPTKSPHTSAFTSPRVPKSTIWTYFRSKSHTTRPRGTTNKSTAKRQTQAATQPYTYGQYTTAPSVYNLWNYSPTTADPRTVFYPWTTKKPPLIVPQAYYPYFAGANVHTNMVVAGYQPYYETASVQIGGRATNRTSEKLKSAPWAPPSRRVEVVGVPSPLDPKFKLAVVTNYENFNETSGTFGFDIDLENGVTVRIRGFKKNGTQILDGSFSLFTNEGEPVRIAYTAEDDKVTSPTSTIPGPESKVPKDGGETSTAEEDEAVTTTTTTTTTAPTSEFLDN